MSTSSVIYIGNGRQCDSSTENCSIPVWSIIIMSIVGAMLLITILVFLNIIKIEWVNKLCNKLFNIFCKCMKTDDFNYDEYHNNQAVLFQERHNYNEI